MKRHWLRGLLLGVSLALLLGGGVALAQSMSIEPYCGVCCDKCREPWLCDGWAVSSSGWAAFEPLDVIGKSPGPWGTETCHDCTGTDGDGKTVFRLILMCAQCPPSINEADILLGSAGSVVAHGLWQPGDYGEWTLKLKDTAGEVGAQFYFAEDPSDCLVEEEFVPEPGSILLLGSGLAGLAGYATLRWRTRE